MAVTQLVLARFPYLSLVQQKRSTDVEARWLFRLKAWRIWNSHSRFFLSICSPSIVPFSLSWTVSNQLDNVSFSNSNSCLGWYRRIWITSHHYNFHGSSTMYAESPYYVGKSKVWALAKRTTSRSECHHDLMLPKRIHAQYSSKRLFIMVPSFHSPGLPRYVQHCIHNFRLLCLLP